jgi:anti-sigma factor RsiW
MNAWIGRIWPALEGHPSESELQAYVDGELEPVSRREVYRHLAYCARCKEKVAASHRILNLIAAADLEEDVLSETRERLFRKLQEQQAGPASARMRAEVQGLLGTAAAVHLVLSSGRIPAPVEAQITAFLGTRAAMQFRRRWMAVSGT